ncbi:hypothetical protein ACFE04_017422 [Oxalis oulophora]
MVMVAPSMDHQTYIIHLDKTKITNFQNLLDSIAQLSTQDEENSLPPQLLYAYETAIHGFAIKLSTKQLESLKKINGFISATPDEILSLHTTSTPKFLGLQKIIGARIFFKGYEAAAGSINTSIEYKSPRDRDGHGTHTASTAAGNLVENANFFGQAKGNAAGIRYTSRIAVYKVCWKQGCASSDIIAGIEAAVSDGVDVLSLSLGGSAKPYDMDNIAIGAFGATQKGVIVSSSAGNSGPFKSSVSNTAPWIMTVAASYLDRRFPTTVKLGNGKTFEGSSLYFGKPTKQLPIFSGNSTLSKYCFSGSLTPEQVKGKIVVCIRGLNGRNEKGEVVKKAKGSGMLLVNSKNGGEELFADAYVLPASALGAKAGEEIGKYLNSSHTPTAQIIFKGTTFDNLAPVMAAFSSRGPNPVGPDVIKPDITAPGMNILAAWPSIISPTELETDPRRVQFNIISGTSMSCPHMSGIAALIKSVHKEWSPAAIKSAIMTTAYTIANNKAPIVDISSEDGSTAATPFTFGSGHVNPESATDPGLIYDITTSDYLNYLCTLNYTKDQISKFSKGSSFKCPKNRQSSGNLNYPSFAVNLSGISKNATTTTTTTYKRTVTNVGNTAATYKVKIEQPMGVSVTVHPTTLKFKKIGQKLSYKVSFVMQGKIPSDYSFGSLVWISGKYVVRSPIAITWQ